MESQQVYYWRSRMTDVYPMQWISSSFKYVPNKTGWSQSRVPQMSKDILDGIRLDQVNRDWEFDLREVLLHAAIQSFSSTGVASYFLGSFASQPISLDGVLYTPIDQKRLRPLVESVGVQGDWQFSSAPSPTSSASVMSVVQMISVMEPGDYFLLVSSNNPYMEYWPDEAIHAFEQVGANFGEIRSMTNGERFILFGRKGAPLGSAILINQPNLIVPGNLPEYDLQHMLSGPTTQGNV